MHASWLSGLSKGNCDIWPGVCFENEWKGFYLSGEIEIADGYVD